MNKLEEKVDGLMQGEGLEAAKSNYSDARTIQVGEKPNFKAKRKWRILSMILTLG